MLTPLKYSLYKGALAKYNNFEAVLPDLKPFLIQPIESIKVTTQFGVTKRGYHRISKYKDFVIVNKETGVFFDTITELSDALKCSRNCVSKFLQFGRAGGWVNPQTKEFIMLQRKDATISNIIDLEDAGFVKAHWNRVRK